MADQAQPVLDQLRADDLTPEGEAWTPWPGGWPDEISTALIDAVFSARATYKTSGGAGVYAQVVRWRELQPEHRDTLRGLRDEIDAAGVEAWARTFGNMQHSPSRSRQRPDTPWKSAAVLEAAEALTKRRAVGSGVDTAQDVTSANSRQVAATLMTVPGIGRVTADYFLMLLGYPGVKADTMIRRYLAQALDGKVRSVADAVAAVTAAAATLGCDVVHLEHSIWAFESARSRTKPE